jgi:Peptidase_C39 like family
LHFPRFFIAVRRTVLVSTLALTALLGAPLAAVADTEMTVPTLSQQDGRWAGAALGSSPTDTVGAYGCAITAVTMMLDYDGIATDPGAFNAWLTANGGYVDDDALLWGAVDAFTGGSIRFSGWLGPDLGAIHHELDYGRPVVAEVRLNGNQHFVLITGYTSAGGLQINDPWFGDAVNFSDRYGDPASGIVSIRTFTFADASVQDARPAGAPGHRGSAGER